MITAAVFRTVPLCAIPCHEIRGQKSSNRVRVVPGSCQLTGRKVVDAGSSPSARASRARVRQRHRVLGCRSSRASVVRLIPALPASSAWGQGMLAAGLAQSCAVDGGGPGLGCLSAAGAVLSPDDGLACGHEHGSISNQVIQPVSAFPLRPQVLASRSTISKPRPVCPSSCALSVQDPPWSQTSTRTWSSRRWTRTVKHPPGCWDRLWMVALVTSSDKQRMASSAGWPSRIAVRNRRASPACSGVAGKLRDHPISGVDQPRDTLAVRADLADHGRICFRTSSAA